VSPRKLGTIGVLGGMGPEATAYFFERLVQSAAAGTDQDHPPVIVYSLPQIPDRTGAVLKGGPSPVPLLLRGLEALRLAGADFAVIPCVTAHYFLPSPAHPQPSRGDAGRGRAAPARSLDHRPHRHGRDGPLRTHLGAFRAGRHQGHRPVGPGPEAGHVGDLRPEGHQSRPCLGAPPGSRRIRRPRARPAGRRGGPGRVHRGPPGPPPLRPSRPPDRAPGHRGPRRPPPFRRPATDNLTFQGQSGIRMRDFPQ
jgi:hypothetical protein